MAADKKKETKEKPLDKMTVLELRGMAKEITELTGIHGMNKEELLSAIKKAKGIEEAPRKKGSADTKAIKSAIKTVKTKKKEAQAAKDNKKIDIFRRKLSRLKKRTRRAA
jgi:hypothetical protein